MNTYLLATDTVFLNAGKTRVTEYVAQYAAEEMAEVFTAAERAELAKGGKVTRTDRVSSTTYVDMVRAARAVR